MITEITAWVTTDGTLFDDEDKAQAYEDDQIGVLLGELLDIYNTNLDFAKHHRALLTAVSQERRKDLSQTIAALNKLLN